MLEVPLRRNKGIIAIDRMKYDVGKTEFFVKISSSNSEGGPLRALDSGVNENREVGASLPCHIMCHFGVPTGIRTPAASLKGT